MDWQTAVFTDYNLVFNQLKIRREERERIKKKYVLREYEQGKFRYYIAKRKELDFNLPAKLSFRRHHIKRIAEHPSRSDLGFNPLNTLKPNYHGHHINNNDVVFIPKEIHMKFYGHSREEHRRLVLEYYGSIENMIKNIPNSLSHNTQTLSS